MATRNNLRKPGDSFSPPDATTWNGMVRAGLEYNRSQELGTPGSSPRKSLPPGCLMLRNDSGSDIEWGGVLEVGSALTTVSANTYQKFPYFVGNKAVHNYLKQVGVALASVPDGCFGIFMVEGFCYAKLDVQASVHPFADAYTDSLLAVTSWHGRLQIVDKQSGTGELEAWVRVSNMFAGPLKGIVTEAGGIDPDSSGEVTVYRNGSSTSTTVTAFLDMLHNDLPVSNNDEVLIQFFPDQDNGLGQWVIVGAPCNAQ